MAIYKDLSEVERAFRQLKDVLAMRPIYHQIESRVKAHIFVAGLAALARGCGSPAQEAGIDFSAERATESLADSTLGTFRMDDRPERGGTAGCPDAGRVRKALKLTDPKLLTPPKGKKP